MEQEWGRSVVARNIAWLRAVGFTDQEARAIAVGVVSRLGPRAERDADDLIATFAQSVLYGDVKLPESAPEREKALWKEARTFAWSRAGTKNKSEKRDRIRADAFGATLQRLAIDPGEEAIQNIERFEEAWTALNSLSRAERELWDAINRHGTLDDARRSLGISSATAYRLRASIRERFKAHGFPLFARTEAKPENADNGKPRKVRRAADGWISLADEWSGRGRTNELAREYELERAGRKQTA